MCSTVGLSVRSGMGNLRIRGSILGDVDSSIICDLAQECRINL